MIYEEYDLLKQKKQLIQIRLDELVTRKEEEFFRTQPQAVQLKQVNVAGGEPVNTFDQYVTNVEPINREIMELRSILFDRDQLLQIKELELRRSSHVYDKVYRMYFLDNMKLYMIMRKLNYSRASIYRILSNIRIRLRQNKTNTDI